MKWRSIEEIPSGKEQYLVTDGKEIWYAPYSERFKSFVCLEGTAQTITHWLAINDLPFPKETHEYL